MKDFMPRNSYANEFIIKKLNKKNKINLPKKFTLLQHFPIYNHFRDNAILQAISSRTIDMFEESFAQ